MTGFTKSFSSNRSGNIEFVDLAGNTGQTFVDIYWIASSTCTNGAINYPTCNNQTPSNGGSSISGGGSGGGSLSKDTCPTGDFSASYYDKTC
ncbi:MAG: hypothetical protein LBG59_00260 [Candidatus Peribacteria bacterium]|jgi:hypothetical protein|nr:hypothetical protein [Candidatus Peribacteria bacterium]